MSITLYIVSKVLKFQLSDMLLVTHSHIDHLMDVPDVVKNTGCAVYGSSNTCKILSCFQVPKECICGVEEGDKLNLGEFKVEVLHANHRNVLGFSAGSLVYPIQPPFRARQYRMDRCFAFHISAGGISFMTDPGINSSAKNLKRADVLFISACYSEEYYRLLFKVVEPKILIPIHWNNFFYSLSVPLKPYFKPPSKKFPFLRKVDLNEFREIIEKINPELKVLIPEIFKLYDMSELNRVG